MATDARLHHPAAHRASVSRQPSSHLRLVPLASTARALRTRRDDERWTEDCIRDELADFYDSPWGACLPKVARVGLGAVLLPPTAPWPFDGYSGVAFLDHVLDVHTIRRHDTISAAALQALPSALRAWVRFNRRASASGDACLTLALLEHIDELEPTWQAGVRDRDVRRTHPSSSQPTSA